METSVNGNIKFLTMISCALVFLASLFRSLKRSLEPKMRHEALAIELAT